ncbi:MAG: hypothetical protein UR28_C0042G0011 [Candidatus Peregrinibacteria bacterium GW2011_GWF2_33_10]|nr:MAG: hypothetical protein UR28_C0042G0011 [Candidatus Peregrinibacteria bacterium GW2011_GWF2_33_10]
MKLLYRNQITINKQLREVWVYEMRKKHSSARLKDDKIIIRLSSKISRRLQQEHAQNLLERLVKSLQKQPPKITKIWQDGEIIEAGDKKYLLHLQEKKQKTVTGKLIAPQAIKVNIPSNLSSKTKNQYIFKLIRQIVRKFKFRSKSKTF